MIAQNNMLSCSSIVVDRLEISRTYDDVVDYVMRELEIRPIHGLKGSKFSGVFYLNQIEITDTLSTDEEMPRMSVAIWKINRVGFNGRLIAKYHMTR